MIKNNKTKFKFTEIIAKQIVMNKSYWSDGIKIEVDRDTFIDAWAWLIDKEVVLREPLCRFRDEIIKAGIITKDKKSKDTNIKHEHTKRLN